MSDHEDTETCECGREALASWEFEGGPLEGCEPTCNVCAQWYLSDLYGGPR